VKIVLLLRIVKFNPTIAVHPTPDKKPDFSNHILYVLLGPDHLAFTALDEYKEEFSLLEWYSFESHETEDALRNIFSDNVFLQQSFLRTELIVTYPDSLLIPNEMVTSVDPDKGIQLLYGDVNDGPVWEEKINSVGIHHYFRIPVTVSETIGRQFPTHDRTHLLTLMLRDAYREGDMENGCRLFFLERRFFVFLSSNAQLKLIRSFDYHSPEDVVYHLLNICEIVGMDPRELTLHYGGLIDHSSPLSERIQQYFEGFEAIRSLEDVKVNEEIANLPESYYSYFFNLCKCV
jgi:Protein of unknown function (DUF3822)